MKKPFIWTLAALLTLCLLGGTLPFAGEKADAAEQETALIAPPAVILDVAGPAELNSLTSGLPSNAVLRIDAQENVVGKDGSPLLPFADLYKSMAGKVIPVLYAGDEASASAVVSVLEKNGLTDAAVASSDPALVRKMREQNTAVRGVLFAGEESAERLVALSGENSCMTFVLPLSLASWEKVNYLQARFRSVWVLAEGEWEMHAAIASGALGIVCTDPAALSAVYRSYTEPLHARMPYNVAHRGLPTTHNENSLSGTQAAVEAGATHVELDGMLTKDKRIVMMHDDRVDRTSSGSGNIEDMTYEQVQRCRLDLFSPEEPIPTLEEIIDVLQGTEIILVFEIKSQNSCEAIVPYLKEILEEKNFLSQCVVISFFPKGLAAMREQLPQVPIADLNKVSLSSLGDSLETIGRYNCGVSTNGASPELDKALRDRGIAGWYWTQETKAAVDDAFGKGYLGLTNNVGAYLGTEKGIYRAVLGNAFPTETELSAGDEVDVAPLTYTVEMALVKGKIWKIANRGAFYEVIAEYTEGDILYHTPVYTVQKSGALLPREGLPIPLIAGLSASGGVILIAAVTAAVLLKKKRK